MSTVMRQTLLLVFLVSFTVLIYWPGLYGPFLLDDLPNFQSLVVLDNNPNAFQWVVESNTSGRLGRPVSMLSFALNYQAHGLDPFGFKLVNLIIHCACILLVYAFAHLLFTQPSLALGAALDKKAGSLALLVAALWAFAPFFVSTVLYPVQRMAQLSTFFMLLALIDYLLLRQVLIDSAKVKLTLSHAFKVLALLCGLVAFSVLAALSKENGLLVLPLIIALEALFLGGRTNKGVLANHWAGLLILLGVVTVIGLLFVQPSFLFAGYENRDFTVAQRLMTQAVIVWNYLINLLVPQVASFGIFNDDVVPASGLFDGFVLPAIMLWLLVAAFLVWSYRARKLALPAAGIAIFIVGHSLESGFIPLELYFEHRNYFPAVGLYIALVYLGYQLYIKASSSLKRVMLVSISLYFLIIGFSTYQRATLWQSEDALIMHGIQFHPASPRLNMAAADLAFKQGDYPQSNAFITRVLALKPEARVGVRLYQMGNLCVQDRALSEADIDTFIRSLDEEFIRYSARMYERLYHIWREHGCGQFAYSYLSQELGRWLKAHLSKSSGSVTTQSASWDMAAVMVPALIDLGKASLAVEILENFGEVNGDAHILLLAYYLHAYLALNDREMSQQLVSYINVSGHPLKIYYGDYLDQLLSEHNQRLIRQGQGIE